MNSKKPFIGITPWYDEQQGWTFIKQGYMEGILASGGMPMLLPLTEDEEITREAISCCQGLLLSGGCDVDAKHFGESNLPFNGSISPLRDVMEINLVRLAIQFNKPILGICRGIQMMNIALGGSLYQDIYLQPESGAAVKHVQEAPKWYPIHSIKINSDSLLSNALGCDEIGVNSFHHQAIKKVASGFVITAQAGDGIIEAIECKDHPFAVGVQWHPELMWTKDRRFLGLFQALVQACDATK